MEKQNQAESRFKIAKTSTWKAWEGLYSKPCETSVNGTMMLNFEEHDELVHGRGASLIKLALDKSKYTALYEDLKTFGRSEGSVSQKMFNLVQQIPALMRTLAEFEKTAS